MVLQNAIVPILLMFKHGQIITAVPHVWSMLTKSDWKSHQERSLHVRQTCTNQVHKYGKSSFFYSLLLNFSNSPTMKKNQTADGITKPDDGNGSERHNEQFVRREIGSSRKIGCLLIDSAAPNNDAESITDWERICSHCC